jgi:hypothetical protein
MKCGEAQAGELFFQPHVHVITTLETIAIYGTPYTVSAWTMTSVR